MLFWWKQNENSTSTSCVTKKLVLWLAGHRKGGYGIAKPPYPTRSHSADGDKALHAGRARREPIPPSSQYLIKKLTERVKRGFCTISSFCLLQYKLLRYLSGKSAGCFPQRGCGPLIKSWRGTAFPSVTQQLTQFSTSYQCLKTPASLQLYSSQMRRSADSRSLLATWQ